MDAIPIFSQAKSVIQVICGQKKEAGQTQKNFSRQCPIVSQTRSLYELLRGDKINALETQKECGRFALNIMNGIPIVGHVKGSVHYVIGQKAAGEEAIKAASRTTTVIGGGIGGFLAGGPVGATALAIASGTAYDACITAVDSARHDSFQPYGVLEPFSDPSNAGKWCDAVGSIAMDGVTGHLTGKVVQKIQIKKAAGTTRAKIMQDIMVFDDKILTKPSRMLNIAKVLVIKAQTGYLYLLKDGNMIRLRNQALKLYNQYRENNIAQYAGDENTSTVEIDAENKEVDCSDASIEKDILIKQSNGKFLIFLGTRKIMEVYDDRIFLVKKDGTTFELVEGSIYHLENKIGEIEELDDSAATGFVNSLIDREQQQQELITRANSITSDDTMSLYQDAVEEIVDMGSCEEDDDTEEEYLGLGAQQKMELCLNTH